MTLPEDISLHGCILVSLIHSLVGPPILPILPSLPFFKPEEHEVVLKVLQLKYYAREQDMVSHNELLEECLHEYPQVPFFILEQALRDMEVPANIRTRL